MKTKKAIIYKGLLYIPHRDERWMYGATCSSWCDLYDKEKQRCRKHAMCDNVTGRYYKCKGKVKDIILEDKV